MNYNFKVLTVRDLEFENGTGRLVQGMQLWVIGESAEPAWNGYEVVKLWIPWGHKLEDVVQHLKHDDVITVTFDRHGKPIAIELAA